MRKHNNMLPITMETTLENAQSWLGIVRYGESGTVIQLQDDCEYYIPPIISDFKILKKNLGSFYRKYLLGYIRFDEGNLLFLIHQEIIRLCLKRKIGKKEEIAKLSLSSLLDHINREGLDIGLFISHTRKLFSANNYEQLFKLEHLLRIVKNFSVVFFCEIDITHPRYHLLFDKCSSLYTNIITYPIYDRTDVMNFIDYNCRLWRINISSEFKQQIYEKCGGYLWLVRQLLRCKRNNPKASIHEFVRDELFLSKIIVIWNKFTENEKEILRKVYFHTLNDSSKESHEFKYLAKIKSIKVYRGQFILGIPVLEYAIIKEKKLGEFFCHQEKIFYGKSDISQFFSNKEFLLLKLMIENKSVIVSREQVAKTLWQNKWQDKYSDWAIDRLCYRIRKKLSSLNINPGLFKAAKSKGLIFG